MLHMLSGFQVLKYHYSVQVNEMTCYKEETSINLTNISEQVYCLHFIYFISITGEVDGEVV